jgi:hypothetical protein
LFAFLIGRQLLFPGFFRAFSLAAAAIPDCDTLAFRHACRAYVLHFSSTSSTQSINSKIDLSKIGHPNTFWVLHTVFNHEYPARFSNVAIIFLFAEWDFLITTVS